jgi:hypothetical protein
MPTPAPPAPSSSQHDWAIHVGGTAAICLVVGLLNYLIRGGHFGLSMLYSFAIGVQISAYISLLQTGMDRLLRRIDPARPAGVWVGWGWMLP